MIQLSRQDHPITGTVSLQSTVGSLRSSATKHNHNFGRRFIQGIDPKITRLQRDGHGVGDVTISGQRVSEQTQQRGETSGRAIRMFSKRPELNGQSDQHQPEKAAGHEQRRSDFFRGITIRAAPDCSQSQDRYQTDSDEDSEK